MISALVWNVRGIGSVSSIRRLRKLVAFHSISLLILQEPLVNHSASFAICRKLGFVDCLFSDNNKIWILWKNSLSVQLLSQSEQYLHCVARDPSFTGDVFVTGIYGLSTRSGRRSLWADLLHLHQACSAHPWFIGGDFNCLASVDESVGPLPPDLGSINDFADFLGQCDLRELPASGGSFTWTGMRARGRVWRKLDRLLFNSAWFSAMPSCTVQVLNRATSDHSPLLLTMRDQPSVPKSFRFQSMWLRREGFSQVVTDCWQQPFNGFGMYRFSAKLRRLKTTLRHWNKTVFGNVFRNVQEAEE